MVGNANAFPVSTTNSPNQYCPTGLSTIGTISGSQINGLSESAWSSFTFNFTAPINSNILVIGGVCLSDDNFYVFVDDVSITSNCTNSTAPSSISVAVNCPGATRTLTRNGGSLGTGASWKWYRGSCAGTAAGTGNSITVNPSSTTTYYVRAEGDCNTSSYASVTVSIASNSGTYTWDGSHNTNWHEPCNWNTNKVPTSTSAVIIPGGTPRNPTVNAGQTAVCTSLQINYSNGALVTVNSSQGATLQVH